VRAELDQIAMAMATADEAVKALGEGAHELAVQIVTAEKDIERLDIERPQCVSRRDVVRYEIDSLQADAYAAEQEERGRP
jgi:septal ring factor EnvC (AmiA/AmiB activator)